MHDFFISVLISDESNQCGQYFRASDRVWKKNNKLYGNFQEHYVEESVDYAENILDYAENFRLALLTKNHIVSCS